MITRVLYLWERLLTHGVDCLRTKSNRSLHLNLRGLYSAPSESCIARRVIGSPFARNLVNYGSDDVLWQTCKESPLAELEFQPYRRSIEELLLGSDYYAIPRFQRPYGWDQGNLDEFWRDTIEDNQTGYFIGPMVAYRSGRAALLSIVDGQQRLTTITILLAVLRDAFGERGMKNLAVGLHRYIERPDRDNELRFVLQPEVTARFLNHAILASSPDRTARPSTEEEHALQRAHLDLRSRVDKTIRESRESAETVLKRIRDRSLGLRVIWVEHGNEDDAYILFETLNTRGKDLEVVDLLKNYLLNKLRRKNRAADNWRDIWNDMRTEIEGSRIDLDINRYILHWWLSHEPYVAQKKLFRDIKKRVKAATDAEARLRSLKSNASWYRAIFDPQAFEWSFEEKEIPESLYALSVFRVVQPAPLLLALIRSRRSHDPLLKLPQLKKAVKTIERFHFQFTAISQRSSSGGVSEMYAKYARELSSAMDSTEQANVIKRLEDALVARKPDKESFIVDFMERLALTNEFTKDKKLVHYVLRRLLQYTNPQTSLTHMTVEHIRPQSTTSPMDSGQVGSIGNLLYVDESLNTKLADKPFTQKQSLLSKHSSHYDVGDILAEPKWNREEIEKRARRLGELAYDKVWHLPVR